MIIKYLTTSFFLLAFSFISLAQSYYNWVEANRISLNGGTQWIVPNKSKTIHVDLLNLKSQLKSAPKEFTSAKSLVFNVPLPDGTSMDFKISESKIMEEGLAIKYPGIKAYTGYGINDPSVILKMDVTPVGMHAYIVSKSGTYAIDPFHDKTDEFYIVYDKKDYTNNSSFECLVKDHKPQKQNNFKYNNKTLPDCTLREYRLAVNATGEYTQFHGGTVSGALAAIVTTVNRVNMVFERDINLRMVLVADNDMIIYTNASTDPFTNGNPEAMVSESHANLNFVIRPANYDIGHVFGTAGSGLAQLASVCSNTLKGVASTGINPPINDMFSIDYVAHEFGHQFGAQHTFEYCDNGFGDGPVGNGASGMEPGSGSTIMAYAGICGMENLQDDSDDYFHAYSIFQMTDYTQADFGNTCATIISTSNNAPEVEAGPNYYIPGNTPFQLTGSATDADGDALTYCWEEFRGGPDASIEDPLPLSVLFRSWTPKSANYRIFPRLFDLKNNTTSPGETLPFSDRNMKFRLTVRDNHIGGACTAFDEMTVLVDGDAGPFTVNTPNGFEEWAALDTETISWNVAGTDQAPISCSAVDILLSIDGGNTYPVTIASGVPNTGTHDITVPNNVTTVARVKIVCSDGIFFDISNSNFEITAPGMPSFNLNANQQAFICIGQSFSMQLDIGQSQGFSTPVNLSATNVPVGLQVSFSDNPAMPGTSVTISFTNTSVLLPNDYIGINIVGSSGTQTESLFVDVASIGGVPASPNPASPLNGSVNADINAMLTWQGDINLPAQSYQIEIATDPLFNNIVETNTSNVANYLPVAAVDESTTYYWRVLGNNICGQGSWSNISQFTTLKCLSFTNSANVIIPASGTPTITSNITVSNAGVITGVSVENLIGSHTWIRDLSARLTSPEGTNLALFSELCNDEDNFNLNFSADGNPHSAIPCPPVDANNYYRPLASLNSYLGEIADGNWQLSITDNYSQDGGELSNWALNICVDITNNITVNANASLGTICDGQSVTLTAEGAQNYVWSPPDGLSSITGAVVTATPSNTTIYTVTGVDANGALNTAQVTVNVSNASLIASISGLPNSTNTNGIPIVLSGAPAGGTFSGEGVTFNVFNPSNLLPGFYNVTYTVDESNGCSGSVTQSILVAEVIYNFVTYQLGTIQPKIIIEVELHGEGNQPVTLMDLNGQMLNNDIRYLNKGLQQLEIDLIDLPKGIYFIKVGELSTTEKVLVH